MSEQIDVVRIPDGHMPSKPGEISFHKQIPRSEHDVVDEWHLMAPCGHVFALLPSVHQVYETTEKSVPEGQNYGITVHPSIVCPEGDYHGFIAYSKMTR